MSSSQHGGRAASVLAATQAPHACSEHGLQRQVPPQHRRVPLLLHHLVPPLLHHLVPLLNHLVPPPRRLVPPLLRDCTAARGCRDASSGPPVRPVSQKNKRKEQMPFEKQRISNGPVDRMLRLVFF